MPQQVETSFFIVGESMSTAVLASPNSDLQLQTPKARPLEGEVVAYECPLPIARSECAIVNRTSREPGEASRLLTWEGFAEATCPEEKALRPNGILIVEDDRLLRKSLGEGFRHRGFDLWSAANGAEAVELYQQFWSLIDVVLSDVQMPVLDGPGTLDALREINPSVRFCFMTGDTRAATRARLLARGALLVFEKPLPSVANTAQELWEIASCPYEVIVLPQGEDEQATGPERSADELSPQQCRGFAWICALLLTSISRIGSILGQPRILHSRVAPPVDQRVQ